MTAAAPCAIDEASSEHADTYEYDAFGNEINHTGTTPNAHLYRGEQYDSDLGLYYLRARYYNPANGRFISRDPDDHDPRYPNQLHKYVYAGADPINSIDPTGRGDFVNYVVSLGKSVIQYYAVRKFELVLAACVIIEGGAFIAVTENPSTSNDFLLAGAVATCLALVVNGP